MLEPKPLVVGTVDVNTEHFELCEGSDGDSPSTWIVLARVGGDDPAVPVVEFTDECRSRGLVESTVRYIGIELSDDSPKTMVMLCRADGTTYNGWRHTLEARAGSTSNWYGSNHWRMRRPRDAR